jgi:chemotaxis protein MotB
MRPHACLSRSCSRSRSRCHRIAVLTGNAALVAALVVCAGGCTSLQRYDKVVADASQSKKDCDEKKKRDEARRAGDEGEIAKLQGALKDAETAAQERDVKLSELSTAQHNAQASLDEQTAMNQQLRGELTRLGKDVDQILKDKGTLTKSLSDAKSRLDELRKAQASAEARTAIFRDFAKKFSRMIEGKQLTIGVRQGFLVMALSSDLLFDGAKVEIKPAGQGALMEIAHAFAQTQGRRFQVAAHTDNAKVKTSRFPSSWELSAVRAVEVVRFLIAQSVPAAMLSAAGYGDVDPVAPNDTSENRTRNRRIEFMLQPNAEDLVVTPEWKG